MTTTSTSPVWFITGASTGFGRKLAEAVLANGDRVVATARKPETVADLEQQNPGRARAVRLDVTDLTQVKESVESAIDAFGRIGRKLECLELERLKRMQQAEEKAAMVSVKMTVPLVLFILPSLIAVVMGPAIVMITQSFGAAGP